MIHPGQGESIYSATRNGYDAYGRCPIASGPTTWTQKILTSVPWIADKQSIHRLGGKGLPCDYDILGLSDAL